MRGLITCDDSLITGPTLEPLDLDETKKALRWTSTSEDTLLDVWIAAARQHFEEQTGRQILTATWERWLSGFPACGEIELPHPPLLSVVSIKYDDAAGDEQTLSTDAYQVIAPAGPTAGRGRVALNYAQTWPTGIDQQKAVRIRYTAGYGPTYGSVPELVKGALYLLVGHFHRHRGQSDGELPPAAQLILRAFRESAIGTQGPLRTSW